MVERATALARFWWWAAHRRAHALWRGGRVHRFAHVRGRPEPSASGLAAGGRSLAAERARQPDGEASGAERLNIDDGGRNIPGEIKSAARAQEW